MDTLSDSVVYDGWRRVVAWTPVKNGVAGTTETYTFDRSGNISQPTGGSLTVRLDRLVSRDEGGSQRTFTYDRAGNLIQQVYLTETMTYGYDALERLVSVRRNGTLMARYGYDVLGRRVAKRVYSTASGGILGYTRFVYQGSSVAFETDSAGTTGLQLSWGAGADNLQAVKDAGGTVYYPVKDLLGSIRGLTKRDGTWWLSQRFTPYGVVLTRDTSASGNAVALRYGWTGREYDAETGWYFMRARYYSPALRRFVQEDPIGYGGGLNLYAYVDGQPLEARDPSGTEKADVIDGFIGQCFASGCLNGDGSFSHGEDLAVGGGAGGGGSGSYLDIALAGAEARYEWSADYVHYENAYKAAKTACQTQCSDDSKRLLSGSRAMTTSEWQKIGTDVVGVLAARGGDALSFSATISQRLEQGRYFVNGGAVAQQEIADRVPIGTYSGLSTSNDGGFTAWREHTLVSRPGQLSNYVVHETLHQMDTIGDYTHDAPHACAAYTKADQISGWHVACPYR